MNVTVAESLVIIRLMEREKIASTAAGSKPSMRIATPGVLSFRSQVAEVHAAALEQDASVFDYDGVYDSMQEAKAAPVRAARAARSSKYIEARCYNLCNDVVFCMCFVRACCFRWGLGMRQTAPPGKLIEVVTPCILSRGCWTRRKSGRRSRTSSTSGGEHGALRMMAVLPHRSADAVWLKPDASSLIGCSTVHSQTDARNCKISHTFRWHLCVCVQTSEGAAGRGPPVWRQGEVRHGSIQEGAAGAAAVGGAAKAQVSHFISLQFSSLLICCTPAVPRGGSRMTQYRGVTASISVPDNAGTKGTRKEPRRRWAT